MSSSLQKTNQKAKTLLTTVGIALSNDGTAYFMLLMATILTIASICIPYYSDSTGASSGVYGSGKDCLGFLGQDCMTIQAFPVLTIIFGLLSVIFMASLHGMPILSRIPIINRAVYPITNILSVFKGFGIAIIPLIILATLFSIITLVTQLEMPLSGSTLANQAKNSTSPTTFKDGMALSATATALFVYVFLIKTELLKKMGIYI